MQSSFNLTPWAQVLLIGALLASGPALWVFLRQRGHSSRTRALVWVTLFLTFDLVLFGAFTRLTDSGLGCPDWPGCYGQASPVGAHSDIAQAQSAMPSGPVTHGKAWIEMVHRYLATSVGGLILLLTMSVWWTSYRAGSEAWLRASAMRGWTALTLIWVVVQGAFGALTVTMKLFPAIVSLHLLGGYGLLALLVILAYGQSDAPQVPIKISTGLRAGLVLGLMLLVLQAASGAWVSTNYAVLACSEFPMCQGQWLPEMDWAGATQFWRPLGLAQDGTPLSFQALTAIHFAHRTMAMLTAVVLAGLAWRLRAVAATVPTLRKPVRLLAGLLALQLATGLSNVVLGWPLLAAVLHTGGAGALLMVLLWLLLATRSAAPRGSAAISPTDRRNFA